MLGPVLEGDRARREPPARDHLPTVAKWRTDLAATRYLLILQFPPSPKQHEDWLEKVAASQDDVVWSVVGGSAPRRRDSGRHLRSASSASRK